ncbi:molecular chaperone DnaJ [Halospeciosus flavus]|uniref:Chaperone protein DnaJ n=1 Tax=Halospeciosus flavus TaxID=3032283 RepID=A0ABD5Z4N6_9EURY|nr:molecular chaperone DnaJ [Halospeciosus flavus]
MSTSENFYDVLGVSRDADESDIKSAYREKVQEYHPDVSDEENAEEQFKKIQKAKEVLTDDEKREAYDQLGHERFTEAEKHGGFEGGAGGAGGMGGQGNPFGGAGGQGGMGDIFDQFFGGMGGQGQGRGQRGPQPGQDLRTSLDITLEEAYEGVEKQMTVRRPERCDDCGGSGHPEDADVRTCPECNGQGRVTQVQQTPLGRAQTVTECSRCDGEGELYSENCETCHGTGQVNREATLTVEVPAGIRSGQTLRMDREGAPGDEGAPNGDLLVEIAVEDHPDFERDGDDLHHRTGISFPQATFGDTLEIPTLDGTAEFDLPESTQSGETFRLRGKGMPRLRGRGQGDLYVHVQVVTPEELNEEQKEALMQFAEAGGEEVEVSEGFFERLKNSL